MLSLKKSKKLDTVIKTNFAKLGNIFYYQEICKFIIP